MISFCDYKQSEKWENQQKQVFIKAREEFKNEFERNTYMGYTLNNLGLGPGPSLKNADYV
jgi:hypothetical protein